MNEKDNKKYNIGLDIGTTSVGWAVVEEDTQKIIRKGSHNDKKSLWGVRLFEEADSAANRRNFRSTRRRYDRRTERIKLLQDEFREEINKVDQDFFKKLKESKYKSKDKINKTVKISDEENKQIRKYNKDNPTIYHLRKRLMFSNEKMDVRLVYLAIHHIIKYRGNFLYGGDSFNVKDLNIVSKLREIFEIIYSQVPELEISEDILSQINYKDIETILMMKSKNDIKVGLKENLKNLTCNNKFPEQFSKMIVGNKFEVNKLLMIESEKDISISFDGTDYEDKYDEIEKLIGDNIEIIGLLKQLYDMLFLKKIFNSESYVDISSAMVDKYEKHGEHLKYLKSLFKCNRDVYKKVFKTSNYDDINKFCLYDKYVYNKISYDEFIKEISKLLNEIYNEIDENLKVEYLNKYKSIIENGDFLPRITSQENGKYPYQLNKNELIKIIENQGRFYPFLKEKINGEYKIVKLLEFRIPYYVGPLMSKIEGNDRSKFSWMIRRENGIKITPYNFDEIIDKEATAERFITRMISHCTYLLDEYALPNNSIKYSLFKVMNELKQIKVNGNKLLNEIQIKIIDELFKKQSGVITDSKFKKYLYASRDFDMYGENIEVTGYSADGQFANNLSSYIDFFGENGIFNGTSYNEDDAEEIIRWITIFEDKDILEQKVRNKFVDLNESQVKKIVSKKYKGWGNLSLKLLDTKYYIDKKTNIKKSILDLMYETEENFMQILNNDEYKFQKMIKEYNHFNKDKKLSYELVDVLATSPATKRGIYQSLKVVDEIIDYMGYLPENIIIEMARENGKKGRKVNRKEYLEKLYKNSKEFIDDYQTLMDELSRFDPKDITDRVFLYFIQQGKCLYTFESLKINDLSSYDIDHILPRTLIKDDSIDNKALALKKCNSFKSSSFVVPSEYRTETMKRWWQHLLEIKLISPTKFYRLTRDEYKDEDIKGFINRQLVETRQITKHVANIIENLYGVNVVYLKASISRDYRNRYELYKFRELNDYHHAFDAYLAAVLGEYKEKYLKTEISYEMIKLMYSKLKENKDYERLKYGYVINSFDDYFIKITSEVSGNIFNKKTGEVFSIDDFSKKIEHLNKMVEDTYYRNDVIISKKIDFRNGEFYNQNPLSMEKGNIKLKKNMPVELYGGYTSVKPSYMCLVKYMDKKKMIGIPIEVALRSKNDKNYKLNFIMKHLELKCYDDFEILRDNVPFDTLINYKNHNVYIKGYSVSHKKSELCNAIELNIEKSLMKKWKYVLNEVINNCKNDLSENDKMIIQKEIINYLFNKKEKFPLFKTRICRIEDELKLDELNLEELSKIIIELLKIYRCKSENANFKDFGLGDRIERLNGINIGSGIIIFNSTTGLKKFEFQIEDESE